MESEKVAVNMIPEVRQVLLDAAKLIRKGWTQRAPARDAQYYLVSSKDSTAAQWCIIGAIYASAPTLSLYDAVCNIVHKALNRTPEGIQNAINDMIMRLDLTAWNDTPGRTQKEVITLIERIANEGVEP